MALLELWKMKLPQSLWWESDIIALDNSLRKKLYREQSFEGTASSALTGTSSDSSPSLLEAVESELYVSRH